MAGTSLLALIDDIASLLDDVSVMSKVAVHKTAGVLGDDLALNAQQVTGLDATRELPVVWAVAKGSLVNKAILVPSALLISAVVPWLVVPLLMVGGLFLCYEGFHKVAEKFLHADDGEHTKRIEAVANPAVDMIQFEKEKIRGAIRTDFILSSEIVVISLGTVATATFLERVGVLIAISFILTFGVYGLVAAIVKMDDVGFYLQRQPGLRRRMGNLVLRVVPWLMKFLGIAGTAAMFVVGGGILTHGISVVGHWIEGVAAGAGAIPSVGFILGGLTSTSLNALAGVAAGAMALGVTIVIQSVKNLLRRFKVKS